MSTSSSRGRGTTSVLAARGRSCLRSLPGGRDMPGWPASVRRRVGWPRSPTRPAAGGAANGGGPHNDSPVDLLSTTACGTASAPRRSRLRLGGRYGCCTRRCHATNPHGADSSNYKLFAAKLLFNDARRTTTPNPELVADGNGTYGGDDAVWDALGATDASSSASSRTTPSSSHHAAGDILSTVSAPDANETHALVAGLTCGRPSNRRPARTSATLRPPTPSSTRASGRAATTPPGITAPQRLPHRQHPGRGSRLRWQRQPRLQDRPRSRYVRRGLRDGFVLTDRRLHELPRPDRLRQHRRGQLHVPARPDGDRDTNLISGFEQSPTATGCPLPSLWSGYASAASEQNTPS